MEGSRPTLDALVEGADDEPSPDRFGTPPHEEDSLLRAPATVVVRMERIST